jgi:ribonuclease VapC
LIVVDSSALLAIYFDEPESADFAQLILSVDAPFIAAPNFLEASLVVEGRHGEPGSRRLDNIAKNLDLQIMPFDAGHVEVGREAFRRFGKGRHAAKLNFGDCCAYALAKTLNRPLLFKGNDFALTDIKRAI